MKRLAFISLFAAAAVASAAESDRRPQGESQSPALVAPPLPAARESTAPATPRMLSPEATARLAAAAPKFASADETPPPSALAAPATERPRNGIVRLPRYLVQEPRAPVLRERDLLTSQGKVAFALERHPGFRIGSFGVFNNAFWAREMIEQEFALQRQQEMSSLLSLLPSALPPSPTTSPFSLMPSSMLSSPWRSQLVPWERH